MLVMNVNPNHLRVMLYKYEKRMPKVYEEESKNMLRNCANEHRTLLIQNIMWGKYSSIYPELSPGYEKWKEKQGGESGFWKLWGSLVSAISVRETPKGFSVGIEKDAMPIRTSSMGRKRKLTPIWMYAWYGEYSHRQRGMFFGIQPSRPVFRPTQNEYRLMFLDKRRKEAFDKIKRAW